MYHHFILPKYSNESFCIKWCTWPRRAAGGLTRFVSVWKLCEKLTERGADRHPACQATANRTGERLLLAYKELWNSEGFSYSEAMQERVFTGKALFPLPHFSFTTPPPPHPHPQPSHSEVKCWVKQAKIVAWRRNSTVSMPEQDGLSMLTFSVLPMTKTAKRFPIVLLHNFI